MYLNGEAGPPDPKRALPLLQTAAAANHPLAQFDLAKMYESGQDGVLPKDPAMARKLYAAAAAHGMKEAQARLDALSPAAPATPGLSARSSP
jgi:TPR repeat protein